MSAGLTADQRRVFFKKMKDALTPEQNSERVRKGWATRHEAKRG